MVDCSTSSLSQTISAPELDMDPVGLVDAGRADMSAIRANRALSDKRG